MLLNVQPEAELTQLLPTMSENLTGPTVVDRTSVPVPNGAASR